MSAVHLQHRGFAARSTGSSCTVVLSATGHPTCAALPQGQTPPRRRRRPPEPRSARRRVPAGCRCCSPGAAQLPGAQLEGAGKTARCTPKRQGVIGWRGTAPPLSMQQLRMKRCRSLQQPCGHASCLTIASNAAPSPVSPGCARCDARKAPQLLLLAAPLLPPAPLLLQGAERRRLPPQTEPGGSHAKPALPLSESEGVQQGYAAAAQTPARARLGWPAVLPPRLPQACCPSWLARRAVRTSAAAWLLLRQPLLLPPPPQGGAAAPERLQQRGKLPHTRAEVPPRLEQHLAWLLLEPAAAGGRPMRAAAAAAAGDPPMQECCRCRHCPHCRSGRRVPCRRRHCPAARRRQPPPPATPTLATRAGAEQ